jgi:hypothetical protein
VAADKEFVVMVTAALTVIESDLVADELKVSVTCTVKFPAGAVGLPLMTPAELRANPAGSA